MTSSSIQSELPWYTHLLGKAADGADFDRLVADLELRTEEAADASGRWFENGALGVSVFIRSGMVDAIQLYSAEHPDFDGYPWPLALALTFEMTRAQVRQLLGSPDDVTPARHVAPSLSHSGIDRYDAVHCTVAITYSTASSRVEVVSFEANPPARTSSPIEEAK